MYFFLQKSPFFRKMADHLRTFHVYYFKQNAHSSFQNVVKILFLRGYLKIISF